VSPDALATALSDLSAAVPGVRGVLLASTDGYPIAEQLPDHSAAATAAIVASTCKLGERLADLTGDGGMREIVVRGADGYVVVYTIGDLGVLTVLTQPSANLARLHLQARDLLSHLEEHLAT
jgi:uncharacterized protein